MADLKNYIGLDLGGTNIKAGLISERGDVLANCSVPTEASQGPEHVMDRMAEAGRTVAEQGGVSLEAVRGIGVGAPGPLNLKQGIVVHAPNMPGWKSIALRDGIRDRLGCPTVLENDANAAAFGEYWVGAASESNVRHMVMITLGTGVGGGLVVDGRVVHGAHDFAGEVGHMIVVPGGRPCGSGTLGTLESYTSASNTAARAQEAVEAGEASSLTAHLDAGNDITAEHVFDAARAGDTLALRIVDETAYYLGIACVNLCRLLDPQKIVFAGGMIHAGDFLFDRINQAFRQESWKIAEDYVQIVPAELGNNAGIIGAAGVAWDADQHGELSLT